MLPDVWAATFLSIIETNKSGKSPFDNKTDLEYDFMRFGNDNLGSLFGIALISKKIFSIEFLFLKKQKKLKLKTIF